MKPKVDPDLCIGCGLCEEICPENFELREDDLAHIIKEECEEAGCCEEAAEQCPVDAITME